MVPCLRHLIGLTLFLKNEKHASGTILNKAIPFLSGGLVGYADKGEYT